MVAGWRCGRAHGRVAAGQMWEVVDSALERDVNDPPFPYTASRRASFRCLAQDDPIAATGRTAMTLS